MSPCPTSETLNHFLECTLPDREFETIELHLRECPTCNQHLEKETDEPVLTRWVSEATSQKSQQYSPGSRIGSYRLIAELARGGMGVVYRARDESVSRDVALKLLPGGGDLRQLERTSREAKAVGSITSDHIVPIFAADVTSDGRPYLVMPLIGGATLKDKLRNGPMPPREAADTIRQIAVALEATHAAGFIHRDVKPSNILLDAHDGRGKLTDFGLVRNSSSELTREGVVAGTPEYLSPEQATGVTLDSRTDIYSLGITFYECLTGTVPFRGSPLDVLEQHRSVSPVSPRQINHSVPKDLETICLKCVAKPRERRYASAEQLRDDLERWLSGRAILARPAGPLERSLRWCARNPWPVAFLLVAAFGSIATAVGWWRANVNSRLAEDRANDERVASSEAKKQSELADQRALSAISSINVLVTKSQNLIGNTPGTLNLKKQLNEVALQELRKLTTSLNDHPGAERSMILAHLKLGDSLNLLGQSDEAVVQWKLAIEVCERRLVDHPTDWLTVQDFARAHNSIGFIRNLVTDYPTATTHMKASIDALQRAHQNNPDSIPIANNLSSAHAGLADVCRNMGRTTQALEEYQKATELIQVALLKAPDNAMMQQNLYFDRGRVGYLQRDNLHDYVAAEATFREQLAIVTERVKQKPDDPTWQWYLRLTKLDHSASLQRLCRFAEAEELAHSVLKACENAAAEDSDNVMRQRDLAMVWSHIGAAQVGAWKFTEAQASFAKELAILETVATRADRIALIATDLVDASYALANTAIRTRDYTTAITTSEKLLKYSTANLEAIGNKVGVVLTQTRIGNYRESLKQFPNAEIDAILPEKLPDDIAVFVYMLRILFLARNGQIALADQELMIAHKRFPNSGFLYAAQAGTDGQAVRLTKDSDERTRRLASGCKAILRAAELNPQYLVTLYLAPETVPLRESQEFRRTLREFQTRKSTP